MSNGSRTTLGMGVFGFVIAVSALPSCQREAVYPIVGPDGSRMVHVACDDAGRCYQIAGNLCPTGYDVWLALGDDARNVLVRCRAPVHAAPTVAQAPPPAPPPPARPVVPARASEPASAPAAESQRWPPAAEPGTWPSAERDSTWPPKPDQATNDDAPATFDVGY